jgi:flagellar hook-associated protein 1 FlgK
MTIPGTFFGLNIGLTGLNSAQAAQVVTGNNISNAGTAGYTDETAVIATGPDGPTTSLSSSAIDSYYGGGSVVNTITRASDQYLDAQVQNAQGQSSQQSALSTALGNVQNSFNEPSTSGISAAISNFFNSVTNLQNSPSDVGVRATVVDTANALAQVMQTVQSNLTSNNQSVATNITQDMSQINTTGQQIATLNVQIQQDIGDNIQPNSLLDQRAALVNTLSTLANVTTSMTAAGAMNVNIGSTTLVSGLTANTVDLATMQSRGDITSGALSGLTQAQTAITGYQSNLDTLASTIITSVNQVQQSGMGLDGSTNIPLFTGTSASTIAVNPTLVNDPSEVAAAAFVAATMSDPNPTPPPSDASNAVLLGNVSSTNQTTLSNQTIPGYFNNMITNLGGQTKAAQTAATDAQTSTTQLTNQQSSIEGVDVDTQMTNMMVYQRSYQASAQFIAVQDDMLNTLVNSIFGTS